MVYGAVNNKDELYNTQMGRVFEAIVNRQNEYHRLITDMDGWPPNFSPRAGELLLAHRRSTH